MKSRDVRNAFEHFDERVVEWFEAGDTDIYASRKIGVDTDWPPPGSRSARRGPLRRAALDVVHLPLAPEGRPKFLLLPGQVRFLAL